MSKKYISPDDLHEDSTYGFTHAIECNGTLYMSGQVGRDDAFELVGEDVESQTRQAFANVATILEEVDKSLDDVVKVTSYVVDLEENGEGYIAAWNDTFDDPYPCHTLVGTPALANEGLLVEMEVEVPL